MPTIPQKRFNEFLQDIEPSATTKAHAKAAHEGLRAHLQADDEFKGVHVQDFLSGSYKRDTAIRPRKKGDSVDRPDVDIIVVTNHTEDDDPEEVISLLHRALKRKYTTCVVRKQARSVGVKGYYKADMDVVPLIENGTMYLIPDRKQDDWIDTNPPAHTQWTIDTNKAAGGRFKPLVKLMKWWRCTNPTQYKKPKGFAIECITAQCLDNEEDYYGELFVGTMEAIVEEYALDILLGTVPTIADPGVPGHCVTDGMTGDEFAAFYRKAGETAKVGREALECDDPEKATKKWRKVFGDRFPGTSSSSGTDSSKSLLADAVDTSEYSFPDRPVLPPQKPKGFA